MPALQGSANQSEDLFTQEFPASHRLMPGGCRSSGLEYTGWTRASCQSVCDCERAGATAGTILVCAAPGVIVCEHLGNIHNVLDVMLLKSRDSALAQITTPVRSSERQAREPAVTLTEEVLCPLQDLIPPQLLGELPEETFASCLLALADTAGCTHTWK